MEDIADGIDKLVIQACGYDLDMACLFAMAEYQAV